MFWPMMVERLRGPRALGSSSCIACFIAARTSGGRSVEVLTIERDHGVEEAGKHQISVTWSALTRARQDSRNRALVSSAASPSRETRAFHPRASGITSRPS